MDNLGISSQYVLAAGDIPEAPIVKPLGEVQYANLTNRSPLVSVMPRFAPRDTFEAPPEWIMHDALYRPHFLTLLHLSKIDFTSRFVWPNRGQLALGETVTIPYMTLPLPAAYTADIESDIQPYTAASFLSLISGHTDGIPSREYFKNFFDIMLATEGQWDDLLMNTICGSFVVQKAKGSKWETLYPDVPTIYGAPARQLIDYNLEYKSSDVKTIEVKVVGGKFRLLPYTWLPKPMPVIFIPYQWTRGAFVNIPVGIYFLDKNYVEGTRTLTQLEYDDIRANLELARFNKKPDEDVDLFVRSFGWANFVSVLPHLLFRVSAPYSSNFSQTEDLKVAACIKTLFKKEPDLGLLTFRAVFDDNVVVMDAEDEFKALEAKTDDPGSGPAVTGDAPGITGKETSGTKTVSETKIVNAPARTETVDSGNPEDKGRSIAGPGKTTNLGSPPLEDTAAGIVTADSTGNIVSSTGEGVDITDTGEDDEKLKGGALTGSPKASKVTLTKVQKAAAKLKGLAVEWSDEATDPTDPDEIANEIDIINVILESSDFTDDEKKACSQKVIRLKKKLESPEA